MEIAKLLNALPGAVSQGIIWGIMAVGVYITYKILDVADLTVDGSIATGGAVAAMLIIGGCDVWVAMLVAGAGGHAGGACYGLAAYIDGHTGYPGRHIDPAGPVFH